MKAKMVSVIVPIYNVELYLDRCIKSIINQTYQNIEIILVDDGSPDNSGKICDEYEKIDKRIKVIHKLNGGLSSARNAGLNIAKGEYICFIDSDDWILEKFIECLLKICIEQEADVVMCKTIDVKCEKEVHIKKDIKSILRSYTQEEIITHLYDEEIGYVPSVQNKMYRREIFRELRFKEGIIHEDEEILIKILLKAKKIVITNQILYCYFLSNNSIMRKKFNLSRLNILEALETRRKILANTKYKDTLEKTEILYYMKLIEMSFCIWNSDIENKIIYQKAIEEKIKKQKEKIKGSQYYNTKLKIKAIFILKMPRTIKIYYKLKKRR